MLIDDDDLAVMRALAKYYEHAMTVALVITNPESPWAIVAEARATMRWMHEKMTALIVEYERVKGRKLDG